MTEQIINAIFSAMEETLMDNISIDCDTFHKMMEMQVSARDALFKVADGIEDAGAKMHLINAYYNSVM